MLPVVCLLAPCRLYNALILTTRHAATHKCGIAGQKKAPLKSGLGTDRLQTRKCKKINCNGGEKGCGVWPLLMPPTC